MSAATTEKEGGPWKTVCWSIVGRSAGSIVSRHRTDGRAKQWSSAKKANGAGGIVIVSAIVLSSVILIVIVTTVIVRLSSLVLLFPVAGIGVNGCESE